MARVFAKPEDLTDKQSVALIDQTPNISITLLGIFGQDDESPTPEQVDAIEAELKKPGVDCELHLWS
ncbi:MAG: hypothetical protein OSB68_07190 [Dehalococcoidia bacterium]|nr:hypothetical protein [Dehalococcoidia bacterium]